MKNVSPITCAVVCAGGLAGGFFAGIFVGNRRFQRQLDEEVANVKSDYHARLARNVADIKSRYSCIELTTAVGADDGEERSAEAFRAQQESVTGTSEAGLASDNGTDDSGHQSQRDIPRPPVVIREDRTDYRSISSEESPEPVADVIELVPERDPNEPRVVSSAEFFEDLEGYQEQSLTYYVVDDVLADTNDAPITDFAATVGMGFRQNFGGLSEDLNLQFVINPRLELKFEIAKDHRAYSEVVLGYGNPARKTARVRRAERPH